MTNNPDVFFSITGDEIYQNQRTMTMCQKIARNETMFYEEQIMGDLNEVMSKETEQTKCLVAFKTQKYELQRIVAGT